MANEKLKAKINEKRLKEFAEWGRFDVHFSGDKVMGVGLKWGESKNMENLGFKRKEQIRMLNVMQDNPKQLKKLLGL